MSPKPILIMAGGTGGHVYPALAVADHLRDRGIKLFWLGTKSGLESRIVPLNRIPLLTINISGLRGKGILRWFLSPLFLSIALIQALHIFIKHRPGVVLGMGGFVSGPGGVAAWLLRIPLLIHEQNAIAGLTNRLLAPLARTVMQGFPGVLQGRKVLTTGNPVRLDILNVPSPDQRLIDRDTQPLRLLVLGGSLGARVFNEFIPRMIKDLPDTVRIDILHQTGNEHFESTKLLYETNHLNSEKVFPFIEDMAGAYTWADLVLCRAGALTISELCVAGVASILVPYPYAVDDHQTVNAKYLSDYDCAVLIHQSDLSVQGLVDLLCAYHGKRVQLLKMAEKARALSYRNATTDIGNICLEAISV